jgi:DNA-binding PadR family transcriptional regulator
MVDVINLGEFEQLVLFAVVRLEQASGIGIHDEIEARTGRDVSPGAIYTTLGRLEARGLVAVTDAGTPSGAVGRPRKSYVITASGAHALRTSYASLQALADGAEAKLAKLARR